MLAVGIFVGFFVETVIGFAGALIAMPFLLCAMNLPDAVVYISIFYLFSGIFLLRKEWINIDKQIILNLAFSLILGVVAGIVVLKFGKPVVLKKVLGVFILLYVIYVSFYKKTINLNKFGKLAFGVLAGFFSGVFSAGGPLYVVCLESSTKNFKVFRATMIGVSGMITITRVPLLAVSGLLHINHLRMTLLVFPVFLTAQFLGKLTFNHINEIHFKKMTVLLLAISGLFLLL